MIAIVRTRFNLLIAQLGVLVLTALLSVASVAQSPAALAKKAQTIKPETCGDEVITSAEDCHQDYSTGCTSSEKPRYDAYLNLLKNRAPKPTAKPKKILTR
jgi:hypothetical protein